jgi:branched-subunit amino acid transport protein AzlD
MTFVQQCITIGICALGTMITRFLPFILFQPGKKLPPFVKYLGRALPSAIFAMLVVYCIRNVNFTGGTYGIPELAGIALTTAVHIWKRQMLLSMAAGTIFYMILVQFVFI